MKSCHGNRFRPTLGLLLLWSVWSCFGQSAKPVIYSFPGFPGGSGPVAGLVLARDGFLYGTTPSGGAQNAGIVFKIATNGTGFSLLYSFSGADGTSPQAPLIQGIDGSLYGTTFAGGTNSAGTVFRLSTDGSGFTVLHTFLNDGVDGGAPTAPVLQGSDGMIYGITSLGGPCYGPGVIFKMNTNGNGYTIIKSCFDGAGSGNNSLIQAPDGTLYGTSVELIFSLNTTGGAYNTVYFTGGSPSLNGGLLLFGDGFIYGTSSQGGNASYYPGGIVLKIRTNDTASYIHNFDGTNGSSPRSGLIKGADGALYGTASSAIAWFFNTNVISYGYTTNGSGCVYSLNTDGSGYAVQYMFTGTDGDGKTPQGGLIQGTDGALYGTTSSGGDFGFGTIFRIDLHPTITAQPHDTTVKLGDPAALNASASGSFPLSIQWRLNNADVPGATNASFSFATTVRSNAGLYSLVASNFYGTSTSSNASLVVQIPQVLRSAGVQPDGSFRLTSAYQDAYPLTSADLPNFDAQASTNLVQWTSLTNALTVSNGVFVITDTNTAGLPLRFYRVTEQ